jgi:acetyl-CoA carboxylase biotin carboxyl carrier protein
MSGAENRKVVTVIAPIAGIFYRAPSQDDPPYVEVGTEVVPKQTLCLLETMKVFSKVRSPVRGMVAEIVPNNAEAVMKGQVIFRIEAEPGAD